MATPCRKCGATKTEAVGHGLLYNLARKFGYRLRKCSRCQRRRLLPPHASKDSPPRSNSQLRDSEALEFAAEDANEKEPERSDVCPRCGQKDYRRSRRRWWERLTRRPPMVRCRACRRRFPEPRIDGPPL